MRVPIALAAVFVLGALTTAADPLVDPITKPGEQTRFNGKVQVRVADDGTTTSFAVVFARPSATVGSQIEAKSAVAKGWFVFVESADRVWLYQGSESLTLLEYEDNPPGGPTGGRHSSVSLVPGGEHTAAALAKAPKSVRERLPDAFKAPARRK
ncbi:MAG: hypothetical protein U0791_18915 [Gemmataceae bacterium]